MNNRSVLDIIIRYALLLVLAVPNLVLFYTIFLPLTTYPVYFIINLVHSAQLISQNLLLVGYLNKQVIIEIIPACIAASAYYLLLILNLSIPMDTKKRVKSLVYLILTFLIVNIIRIIVLTELYIRGYEYFDVAHSLTWHIGSTIIVVLIWVSSIYLFKIRNIPVYTDIKNISKEISGKRVKKKTKKKTKRR